MKFIHTADLHLGCKFSSEYSANALSYLYENQKKVLSNIIDAGIKNSIDALFIAGDLFDEPKAEAELTAFVKREFERAPFEIFIVCGNHDPKISGGIYEKENFAKNVHIFSEDISYISCKEADIYGYSFTGPHKTDNSLSGFKPENPDRLNILLIHGDLTKDSFYNPVTPADIRECKADYVALGHIHLSDGISQADKTYYGYSGSPQGLNFKESGEFYIILGELQKGFLKYEKITVCECIFKELSVKVDCPVSNGEILNKIKEKLSSFSTSKTLLRLSIEGFVNDGFEIDTKLIESELEKNLLYAGVTDNTTVKYNIELLKAEQSVRGEFVRNALKELEGKDEEYITKVIEYGVSML